MQQTSSKCKPSNRRMTPFGEVDDVAFNKALAQAKAQVQVQIKQNLPGPGPVAQSQVRSSGFFDILNQLRSSKSPEEDLAKIIAAADRKQIGGT